MPAPAQDSLPSVEEGVRAVVDRDDDRLALMAPDVGDLYLWTREYGSNGVELVMPPGAPQDWDIDSVDTPGGGKHVEVGMWTRQGRSDLTLELDLYRNDDGRWRPRILDLHVL